VRTAATATHAMRAAASLPVPPARLSVPALIASRTTGRPSVVRAGSRTTG